MSKIRFVRVTVVQKKAQVHLLSFSTSLVCLIATANLLSEFGHVAEIALISNAISFFTQSRRFKSVVVAWSVAPFRFAHM